MPRLHDHLMRHHIIIGNGIAGTSTARHLRKRSPDDRITIISKESDHFFSRTALMYIYMGHMTYNDTKPYEDWFWAKNRIDLVRDTVTAIAPGSKTIELEAGGAMAYDTLTLALGSEPNKWGWPGQDLDGVRGLYSKQDLEYMEQYTAGIRSAVVVGGGLIGIEMAEMLVSRGIHTTFLVREHSFWNGVLPDEESAMLNQHIPEHHVDLRLGSEMAEVLPDADGRARAVITKAGEEIPCQFVGLTAGVHPNIAFLKEHADIETKRGILVDELFRTSAPDVYAAGDCAEVREPKPGRRGVEAVWYTGKMHGEYIAGNILGDPKPYDPGVWWNSAKFMDIEYQTYGHVPSKCPEDERDFFWRDPYAQRCLRIRYQTAGERVTGFNLFGLRGRHVVCEHWIQRGATIGEVMNELGALNFDPEFYRRFEPAVQAQFGGVVGATAETTGGAADSRVSKGLFSKIMRSLQPR